MVLEISKKKNIFYQILFDRCQTINVRIFHTRSFSLFLRTHSNRLQPHSSAKKKKKKTKKTKNKLKKDNLNWLLSLRSAFINQQNNNHRVCASNLTSRVLFIIADIIQSVGRALVTVHWSCPVIFFSTGFLWEVPLPAAGALGHSIFHFVEITELVVSGRVKLTWQKNKHREGTWVLSSVHFIVVTHWFYSETEKTSPGGQ